MKTTGNFHDGVRQSLCGVAELIFGNPTDLDPGNRVLDPNADLCQRAVVTFLARS